MLQTIVYALEQIFSLQLSVYASSPPFSMCFEKVQAAPVELASLWTTNRTGSDHNSVRTDSHQVLKIEFEVRGC